MAGSPGEGSGDRPGDRDHGSAENLPDGGRAPVRVRSVDLDSTLEAAQPSGTERAPLRFRSIDIGSTLGRYRILDELGAGGMATVYRARDEELRRDIALKVLFPHLSKRREAVVRFQREARAAAALDHPGIIRVYDVGGAAAEAGEPGLVDPPFLVMELISGRSLREHASEHAPFLAEVVACIGVVLCRALGAAHGAGIIHRDVKPANILVTEQGRVALADFGVARIEDDDSSLVTRSGMLLGTPAFMSPEQAMGDPLDERSDLYSLGATLYQLATGSLPYGGSSARVMTAIAEGAPMAPLQRNPAMGAELARVIERMMARDPAQRYANAGDTAAALGAVIESAGLDSAPGMPEAELGRFFADPQGYTRALTPRVVDATLARARQEARQRRLPRAISLLDRVLALDPECRDAMALLHHLSAGQRRRHWLVAGCAVLVLASAGTAAWWTSRAGQPATAPPIDAGMTDAKLPHLAMHDMDAGQPFERLIDAAPPSTPEPDATPPEVAGTSPGEVAGTSKRATPEVAGTFIRSNSKRFRPGPEVAGTSEEAAGTSEGGTGEVAGTSKRATPEVAGTSPGEVAGTSPGPPEDGEPAPAMARISVDIKPWCDLSIDGIAHGRARQDRVIALPPGRHALVCTQGPGRADWHQTIDLAPGERRHLTGSVLQPVRVHIAIQSGDTVLVDARPHHNGDTLTLQPGRHRITILAGGKELAAAWVSIPAIAACTLRDRPALDCYR